MKKYVKSTLTFFSIVLLILLVFSIRLLSAEINIVKENSDYNGVTIQIKTDIKLYKIKLYKKASNGKFVLFYKSNLHGANNLKIKVSRNLLSTTDKTEIKVVAYDEDGNSLTCGGTIDPVPSAVPMNPSETAKPTSTSSPIPTKPTPTTTATSTSTSTASTSPSSSATATSSTSPSSSATTSETPSSSPSSSSTATPTADTPSSLQDIIKSDQPLTAEQVGQILAYNARVMYEHKKSFGYNVNYGSAVTKKKWDYSVNSSHKQVTSKKAYKYWMNCEGFCVTNIKWSLGVGRRDICGLLSGTGSTINAPKVTMTINGKKYTGGKLNDESINNLRPGDILIWRGRSHLAMYVGEGRIIEMSDSGVREEPVTWYNGSRVLKYVWRPTEELAAKLDKNKIHLGLDQIEW